MLLQSKIGINLFLLVLLCVIEYNIVQSKDAKCEGSVIFHWRIQKNDERNNKKKNWDVLQNKIGGNKSRLSIFFDTDTAFGFTIEGNCCWEIYPKNGYRGDPIKLVSKIPNGFGGIPGFPGIKANSLKKIPCE